VNKWDGLIDGGDWLRKHRRENQKSSVPGGMDKPAGATSPRRTDAAGTAEAGTEPFRCHDPERDWIRDMQEQAS